LNHEKKTTQNIILIDKTCTWLNKSKITIYLKNDSKLGIRLIKLDKNLIKKNFKNSDSMAEILSE
jgi:hypothetical protein